MRLLLIILLICLVAFAASAQNEQPTPPPVTLEAPSLPSAEGTPTPFKTISGVGARPLRSNVIIRSGPGLEYPRIGVLRLGSALDVVSYNGYDLDRTCVGDFEDTLDMWVAVWYRESRAWVARCTVELDGDISRMIVHER